MKFVFFWICSIKSGKTVKVWYIFTKNVVFLRHNYKVEINTRSIGSPYGLARRRSSNARLMPTNTHITIQPIIQYTIGNGSIWIQPIVFAPNQYKFPSTTAHIMPIYHILYDNKHILLSNIHHHIYLPMV